MFSKMEFQNGKRALKSACELPNAHQSTDCWMGGGKQENYSSCTLVIRWRSSSAAAALPLEQYSSGSAALQKRHGHACSKRGIGGRRALAVQNIAQARFKPPKIELSAKSEASLLLQRSTKEHRLVLLWGKEEMRQRPQINLKVGLKKAHITTGCYRDTTTEVKCYEDLSSGVWQSAMLRIRFLFSRCSLLVALDITMYQVVN